MLVLQYLAVPFEEKDEAKSLGAKWSQSEKVWYVPEGLNPEDFDKWIPEFTKNKIDITEKPSEHTKVFWLFASAPKNTDKQDTEHSGKWLLFIRRVFIDQAWAVIKKATKEGRLTKAAKVSTALENPNAKDNIDHVICVYTYDCTDEADVKNVREKLRELGFTKKMPYKSDQATFSGRYSNKGDTNISMYYE